MIERCGDRQRKFDGLEKWPFHLFIESLSIMLQIALLLLTCGLSRHMWSINTSVARVVITFTVLGLIFYIGIVVAATSSHYCPFQTPASVALRALRDRGMVQKLIKKLSLVALRDSVMPQNSVANPSVSRVISLAHATWKSARKGLDSLHRWIRDTVSNPSPSGISLSSIVSGVCSMGGRIGRLIVSLPFLFYRTVRNAMRKLARGIRRYNCTLLPTTSTNTINHHLQIGQRGGLLVSPMNLKSLRKQNADNARCVCWVLRNITDPEAIDSALRLASTVRWFEDGVNVDPPYNIILSCFQECFDPNKVLYPGMRDRAFISGKAIAQIQAYAALRDDRPRFPTLESAAWGCTPRGVGRFMMKVNLIGRGISETPTHMLWMSTLLVATARLPYPDSFVPRGRFGISRASDGNILLAWYVILGGRVQEETFWADDKWYAVFISFLSLFKIISASDLVEATWPFLSQAITDTIRTVADTIQPNSRATRKLDRLFELLDQLAKWKEKPTCLTVMAHQWSLAVCECIQKVNRIPPDYADYNVSRKIRSLVGWSDGNDSHRSMVWNPKDRHAFMSKRECVFEYYSLLLALSLEIGFRHSPSWSTVPGTIGSPANKEHHLLMVEVMLRAASNSPGGVPVSKERTRVYEPGIGDALYVWTLGGHLPSLGSCASNIGRTIGDLGISSRLRILLIRAIGSMEYEDLERAGLEMIVGVFDRLELGFDDICKVGGRWPLLLKPLARSKFGREHLPLRYWHLLEELIAKDVEPCTRLCYPDTSFMKTLEESQEWEKLEIWLRIIWTSRMETGTYLEDVKRVTLSLLQHRPSATLGFASMKERSWHCLLYFHNQELRQICDQTT